MVSIPLPCNFFTASTLSLNVPKVFLYLQIPLSVIDSKPISKPKPQLKSNKPERKPQPRHIPAADFIPDDPAKIVTGMEVDHSRFGRGKVVQIDGLAGNKKATIYFSNFGQKQILLKFAKMKVIR